MPLEDLETPDDMPLPNNAALQISAEEEDGWDDDDFDLSEDLSAPPAESVPPSREAPIARAPAALGGDIDNLNNPDLVHLGPAPVVGGQTFRGMSSDIFGEQNTSVMGRATSPKLYAQVSQFPTCTQLRVWKWENGIPVGLGTIDATATEEDFVRQFRTAMPKKGENRAQFKIRPIDIRGQELGQEGTVVISEHHATLRTIREAEDDERSSGNPMMGLFGRGFGGASRGENGSGEMARELTGMVEHMLATADQRARHLEDTLEAERERMRDEELERTRERVDMATNAAQGVQAITERLMREDARRSEQTLKTQEQQANMLVTTLSTVFAQQQQAMQQQSAEQRRADEFRLQQERQRAEEERRAYYDRNRMEREDSERKRQMERDEMEGRLRREREEAERRFQMEQARMDREREDRKMDLERQKEEARLRYEREKTEMQLRVQQDRERLERERMEHEKNLQREREDADRRLRMEVDRMERDRQERKEQMERERGERDEKARRDREDAKLRDQERQRQHERLISESKVTAQQQREHAERMLQLQKMEMEKKTSFGGLEMLTQFGLPAKEILPRLFGGFGKDEDGDDDEDGGSSWSDALPKMLGAAADMLRSRGDAGNQAMAAQQARQSAARQAAAQRATQQRALAPPPPDFSGFGQGQRRPESPPQFQPGRAPQSAVLEQAEPQRAPQLQPQPQLPPSASESGQVEVQPVDNTTSGQEDPTPLNLKDQAKQSGMALKEIRAARKGMQQLVRRVARSPRERWEEVITAGILSEPKIYDYVRAVTVKAAIDEAGADGPLRDAVMVAMKESSLVPSDLPYGDEA